MDLFLGGQLTNLLYYSVILFWKFKYLFCGHPLIKIDMVVKPCIFKHIQYTPNPFHLDQHLNSTSTGPPKRYVVFVIM